MKFAFSGEGISFQWLYWMCSMFSAHHFDGCWRKWIEYSLLFPIFSNSYHTVFASLNKYTGWLMMWWPMHEWIIYSYIFIIYMYGHVDSYENICSLALSINIILPTRSYFIICIPYTYNIPVFISSCCCCVHSEIRIHM